MRLMEVITTELRNALRHEVMAVRRRIIRMLILHQAATVAMWLGFGGIGAMIVASAVEVAGRWGPAIGFLFGGLSAIAISAVCVGMIRAIMMRG